MGEVSVFLLFSSKSSIVSIRRGTHSIKTTRFCFDNIRNFCENKILLVAIWVPLIFNKLF